MKRPRLLLPLLGLLLIAAALIARALRAPGLALQPFPAPAEIAMPRFDVSLGPAALRGVVTDDEGQPVPEALVKLTTGDEPVWTYTDSRGRFELVGLQAGAHRLLVWSRSHQAADFDAEAPTEDLALVLDRPLGATDVLPPIERAPLRGELAAALEGQALEGYELVLRPALAPDTFGAPIERRAIVGVDRAFAFSDLILGEYRVIVLPPWARGGSWPDLVAPEARSYVHTRATSDRELSIPMASGELSGRVQNEVGQPLEGALIFAHPRGAADRPWPPVATDAEGAFRLRDLPPGDFELEVCAGEATVRLTAQVQTGVSSTLDVPPLATRTAGGL